MIGAAVGWLAMAATGLRVVPGAVCLVMSALCALLALQRTRWGEGHATLVKAAVVVAVVLATVLCVWLLVASP
jgi:hypothetical protein